MRYCLLIFLLFAAPSLAEWHSDEQAIMGTQISAQLWHPDAETARAALAEVMAEMRRIDALYSPYREDSDLSQVNRLAGAASVDQPLAISAEMALLLRRSLEYSRLTDGAFDITFASLGRHYDYRAERSPDAELVAALRPAIDYRLVQLDSRANTVYFQHPDVRLDLGGIAKGYAVDRAIELLLARGISHASVSAGGDTRLLGDRRGRPWHLGIKNPRQPKETAIVLPLVDEAISTSGDYERYFIDAEGRRIHHILNPATGRPAGEVASVSVLGPAAIDTDALATGVFVLGVERGLALLERLDAFEGVLITTAGQVLYTTGLQAPVSETVKQ